MTNTQVEIISQRPPEAFLENWHELATDSHFWFKWRIVAAINQLRELGIPLQDRLQALEVGCATGVLRLQFEDETNWVVDGADLDYGALCKARNARGRTLYYDILETERTFAEAYDVLILFDVLEHVADTRPFVDSLLRHLKPGGLLLVNVPALQPLYSSFDRAARHYRRYNAASLRCEFRHFDLEVLDVRYWGMSLLPVLALRAMILGNGGDKAAEEIVSRGFKAPTGATHQLLTAIMRAETSIFSKPPIGSSLLLAARKHRMVTS